MAINSENKCNLSESFKNMGCETKLAYILIIVLFVIDIFVFLKLKPKKADSIGKWIDENPKAILDSVQKYAEEEQAKAQQQQQEEVSEIVKKNIKNFRDEKNTGVANPKGTKIIVEFYDYNCGYCKMASEALDKIAREDKNIKVIFREFPIFGGVSETAAKYSVAVAIAEPNKFLDFHSALMKGNARTEEGIQEALKTASISVEKIKRTMRTKNDEIDERINENRRLGASLHLQGTPALIIGEEFVPGYVDAETMKAKLR